MSDLHDSSFDPFQQIDGPIVAAQGMKSASGYSYDTSAVNELQLKLVRHSHAKEGKARSSINASKTLPAQMSRLTGEKWQTRGTRIHRRHSVTVKEEKVVTLANARPSDPNEWKGRDVDENEPRACNPQIGKPEPETALQTKKKGQMLPQLSRVFAGIMLFRVNRPESWNMG